LCFAEARVLRVGGEGDVHAQDFHSIPELGFRERVVGREDEARLIDGGGRPVTPVVPDRAPPLDLLFLRVDDGVREARVPLADAADLLDVVCVHTVDSARVLLHTRLYTVENQDGSRTLICGSANLSKQAWQGSKQIKVCEGLFQFTPGVLGGIAESAKLPPKRILHDIARRFRRRILILDDGIQQSGYRFIVPDRNRPVSLVDTGGVAKVFECKHFDTIVIRRRTRKERAEYWPRIE